MRDDLLSGILDIDGLMDALWVILDIEQPDTQTINKIVVPSVELIYSYTECLVLHQNNTGSRHSVAPAVALLKKLLFAPYEAVQTSTRLMDTKKLLRPRRMQIGEYQENEKQNEEQLVAILPLAIAHIMGNLFTKMSLGKVVVSFTHTIKAMEPFFSILLSAMFLGEGYLTSPVQVKVGKVSSPTTNVSQLLEKVVNNEKIDRLLSLLVEKSAQAKRSGHPFPLTIVFVERKKSIDNITLFSVITIMSLFLLTPVALFMKGVKFTPTYLQAVDLNAKDVCIKALVVGICFHAYQQVRHSSGYCPLPFVRSSSYAEIKKATSGFSSIIATHSNGYVYKAQFRGGPAVVVKEVRIFNEAKDAFNKEVQLLMRLHHQLL
ncbi:hypothetical protein GIB67_027733 [Kingdonia uniflora]|uniref:Sugar phosphate transporter domain-containing protein n=1 Tax=Kingdonia uniflora TaxID=39325 RepID=A0A7J7PC63_9MAGN|nr:hypothetical protein GIB67_027733 [Kingdonia uniflora]